MPAMLAPSTRLIVMLLKLTMPYIIKVLLLYDLEQKVGEQRFFEFMQGVAEREITSTTLLLDYAEEVFGKEIRKWIENRIKS